MKNLYLKLTLLITSIFGMFAINLAPALALNCVNPPTEKERLECGACLGDPNCDPGNPDKTIQDTIRNIVNVISILAGAVAVVMIIIGGFRYITSGGNAETVRNARNTILYAVIGLVVIAFAQVIVHFTLSNV
jgi:hypothetical protein